MAIGSIGLSTYIWNNNLKSALLLVFYPLILVGMLWGGTYAFAQFGGGERAILGDPLLFANRMTISYGPAVFLAVAIWFIIAFFFHQRMINALTGAKTVTREDEPHLYNLLENLCISRGLAMPKLCVIETAALNAYASGISERSYAISVTRGLLNALDDAELETVLAHELTHIQNRDVRLLVFCLTFAGMLSFLGDIAGRMLRGGSRSRSRSNGKGAGLIVLIAFVCLMIGYMFAVLLRFAISRKREYLADAGAVELTKNPGALVSALAKISGRSDIPNVPADVRQMFFENRASAFSLFATHPSVESRMEALQLMGAVPYQTTKPLPPAGLAGEEGVDSESGSGLENAGWTADAATMPERQDAARLASQYSRGAVSGFFKWFMMVGGVLTMFVAVMVYQKATAYQTEGQQTTAMVLRKWVDREQRRDSNGNTREDVSYRIQYQFTVNGQTFSKTDTQSAADWQSRYPGERLAVVYLQSDPMENALANDVPTHESARFIGVTGAVLSFISLIWIIVSRKIRRALEPEAATTPPVSST